jgi:vesicle coat complex subunit
VEISRSTLLIFFCKFFESLKNGLQDYDPYVKKTAALAVAKLYGISPKLVVEQDLIKLL